MKQLAIYCSLDLEDRVVAALDEAGIEAFLRVGEGSGHRFLDKGRVPRTIAWDAALFLVPGVEDETASRVADALAAYAKDCSIEPCLRVVASPVEVLC